jgi:hypothetical protein
MTKRNAAAFPVVERGFIAYDAGKERSRRHAKGAEVRLGKAGGHYDIGHYRPLAIVYRSNM